MALNVRVEEGRSLTKTLVLEGRLDNESVGAFDKELDAVLGSAVKVVVFDLTGLEYITSAGLRSIFHAQKVMNARAGKAVLLNPQPQVQKVLDIVKVPDARCRVQERPGARRLPGRDAEEGRGRRLAPGRPVRTRGHAAGAGRPQRAATSVYEQPSTSLIWVAPPIS